MMTRILWLGLLTVAGIAVATRLLIAMGMPAGIVTSWWRLPWHNLEVGGVGWSPHLLGWAVDVSPKSAATGRWLRSTFPVVLEYPNHYHAAWYGKG